MIGPFEQYPHIHSMKQQMHISELEHGQKLERQHKKNYISPQNSHLGFAWNGFRLGVGLRLDGVRKWKEGSKLSAAKTKEKSAYSVKRQEKTKEAADDNLSPDDIEMLKEENGLTGNRLSSNQAESEQIQVYGQSESGKEQFCFQTEAAQLTELQKAVLWAEVLGDPVSRKRRRNRSRQKLQDRIQECHRHS